MRILMLDNEFPPLGGGMGTTHMDLMRYFAPLPDVEIDVITSALGHKAQFEQFSERIRVYKVPVWNRNIHHSSNRELIFYTIQAFFLGLYLRFSRKYDFCFAWSAVPAGGVALALFFLTKLPYMVWVSGPDIPGFEQRYTRLYPVLTPFLRQMWKYANPLIAKCREEVELIHKTATTQPVTVIPNGVDIDQFRPGQPRNDENLLKILCVARLIKRKSQNQLIQAVKRLTDNGIEVIATLVGTGDALASYQQLAEELSISEQIKFVGYVPREDLPSYYAAADVFVLPSFYEGLAVAALAAMSSGLPLVLTRTGGTGDLVDEGINGNTYEWGDIDKLTSILRHLASNRALIQKMGKASRSRVEKFSWPVISRQYLSLFNQISNRA